MPLVSGIARRFLTRSMVMRRSQFETLPPVTGRVLFLGDSITEQGLWDEWFPHLATLNRGIGGNTVGDVLERLDTALYEPRLVSLLVGTNDLSGLGRSRKPDDIAAQMRELVARIRKRAPGAPLIVNSVMPRGRRYADRIRRLNTHCQAITAEAGGIWVDLWPALAAADGSLRSDLTADGLHLNGAGYRAWVDVLSPVVNAAHGSGGSAHEVASPAEM